VTMELLYYYRNWPIKTRLHCAGWDRSKSIAEQCFCPLNRRLNLTPIICRCLGNPSDKVNLSREKQKHHIG